MNYNDFEVPCRSKEKENSKETFNYEQRAAECNKS